MKVLQVLLLALLQLANGLTPEKTTCTRRHAIWGIGGVVTSIATAPQPSLAVGERTTPDSLNVDDYLRSGMVSQPMGVSGQAGKSRPETGVVLREGTEVGRNTKTGDVLAEIVVQDTNNQPMAVLASYVSPWPLATGGLFDVECRDSKTGDGVFLAVTEKLKGKGISDLKDSFFVNELVKPSGRFSFYGAPTDVKLKRSTVTRNGSTGEEYVYFDLSFSTLSQSTQTEIPRKARVSATIPKNSDQVVMLVASTSANRYKKDTIKKSISDVTDSFIASQAPKSSLKVRAKERS